MEAKLDRTGQDVGNILKLEHVNITIPDQSLATLYYVAGLGLTRDPYIMVSTNNMWINVGRSQFHLPTASRRRARGCTGIIVPDREAAAGPAHRREEAPRRHEIRYAARATISSRRHRPWATASAATSPIRRASGARSSACPMSNSTCRRAPRPASRASIRRSWARRPGAHEWRRPRRACPVGPGPGVSLPRDRPADPGL